MHLFVCKFFLLEREGDRGEEEELRTCNWNKSLPLEKN